jgi:UDP-3-O-acyl-N-acetylglucosamine deacetylase
MPRRTLSSPTPPFLGAGLFSGAPATLTIRPFAAGIAFTAPGRGPTLAHISRCVDWLPPKWPKGLPIRNTSIGAGGWAVGTVEHVLSALAGLHITDAILEVDGPEVPILDGSALPFVQVLLPLITELDKPVEPITPRRVIEVSDGGGGSIRLEPAAGSSSCTLTYELDYGPVSPLPPQTATWDATAPDAADTYAQGIAPARTFSLLAEARAARAAGLFPHLSPADMLVIGDDPHNGQPIDNTWRLSNEPARHKLLDLIGDLSLLGRPLAACTITAQRSGHALTRELCRKILADQAL